MKNNEIESHIINLSNSGVFALTLCAKELAHSNMWAWMIEKYPPFFSSFFPQEDITGKEMIVEREKDDRDLTIWLKDKSSDKKKCFVIENKLKSIPTQKQLQNYEKGLSSKGGLYKGLLTGLFHSLNLNSSIQKWSFRSYDDIVNGTTGFIAISKKLKQERLISDFDYELIKEYCTDIMSIHYLINETMDKEYPKNKYISKCEELRKIRLHDIYLKKKSCELKSFLEQKIGASQLESKWGNPEVDISYNNGKATVTIVYKFVSGTREKLRIGVQLEGSQFRIYAGPSNTKKTCEEVFDYFKKMDWFISPENKTINNHPSSMSKKFNKYSAHTKDGNYIHIYQHFIIIEHTEYDSLWKEINVYLKQAKDLIDQGKINVSEVYEELS